MQAENTIHKKELIYGCMHLGGGWNTEPVSAEDEKKAETAVYAALQSGITLFDHADIYAMGKAQIVFGRLLKNDPELRKKITLQSKTGIVLGAGPGGGNIYDLSKKYILQQTEKILDQLQTDHLDILLLHRPDILMNAPEIAETFLLLLSQGLVHQFGVSNMSANQIQLLRKYCQVPLITNQVQLSLHHSQMLWNQVTVNTHAYAANGSEGILHDAALHKYSIQAWGALDRGKFTNGMHDGLTETEKNTVNYLEQLAGKYNTNAYAIALAWLFSIPLNVQPIIGTTRPDRISAAAESVRVDLTHDEWYRLWLTAIDRKMP